jgi:PAT family beta-lactamase induction signal transducer AmpG
MAALMVIGVLTTFFSPSPPALKRSVFPSLKKKSLYDHIREWLKVTYGLPLKDLLHTFDWRVVLAFIFFYKVGDTALSVMNTPFLVELGFSKLEIANVAKFFGISAMITGGLLGGILLNRFGILFNLLLCTVLQSLSSFMFVIQSLVGCDLNVLMFTIGFESLTCGLGAASFIAYLSSLCQAPYTATHFALLSSFGSLARIIMSVCSGYLADCLPWSAFFTLTAMASLPCLFLLLYASHHFSSPPSFLRMAT